MNAWVLTTLIVSDVRIRLEHLSSGFRPDGRESNLRDLGLALLVLVCLALVLWIVFRLMEGTLRRRTVSRPFWLFWRLCQAHQLRWAERWLLWRIAQAQHLRDPGRLFTEPERLAIGNIPPRFRIEAERIQQLQRQLFTLPIPAPTAPQPPSSPEISQSG